MGLEGGVVGGAPDHGDGYPGVGVGFDFADDGWGFLVPVFDCDFDGRFDVVVGGEGCDAGPAVGVVFGLGAVFEERVGAGDSFAGWGFDEDGSGPAAYVSHAGVLRLGMGGPHSVVGPWSERGKGDPSV